ncbi:MAG: glycosyltransferase family 4 protein [Candidatus Magnetomorum sp.]|nr:glycosyltransferase family 4 protein [Candidatus Magnetomorum sp.]
MRQGQKIRVLHPITRLIIGGAQENTMLTASYLDHSQWSVDILSGIQTASEGSIINEVRDRQLSLFLEPDLVREIHPLKDLKALFRLIRLIKKQKYDIVHTHSSKAGIIGRWAAWLADVPVIVHTVHGWGHHDQQSPLIRQFYILLEKITLKITDQLIAVSGKNIHKGLADGIGKGTDYSVIRSGIELDRFGHPTIDKETMRKQLMIPSDATVIGTVIRLSPQKAPLDFIEAAALLARQMDKMYFVIVGDGPLRDKVIHAAKEKNIYDRLIMTGLRRDIPELMNIFDIFVLSSLWEGLPRVIPQAMASGLPVVATAIDGSAEIINSGQNGMLVPPGDPKSIAEAVVQLLSNHQLASTIKQEALKTVDEYSVQKMVDHIESLYERLIYKKK